MVKVKVYSQVMRLCKFVRASDFLFYFPHFLISKDRVTHTVCTWSHVHIFRPGSRKIPVFYYSLIHSFRIDHFHARICMHRLSLREFAEKLSKTCARNCGRKQQKCDEKCRMMQNLPGIRGIIYRKLRIWAKSRNLLHRISPWE